jgi:hypothetical protein
MGNCEEKNEAKWAVMYFDNMFVREKRVIIAFNVK